MHLVCTQKIEIFDPPSLNILFRTIENATEKNRGTHTQWAKTFRGHTQNVPQKVPADILRTFLCDANRHSTANVLRMSKYRLSRTFDEGAWKVRESSSQDIRNPATKILRMSNNRLPRTFDKGASKVR